MYIGSQSVDNMYIGSSPVDAVYLGNTQVWSAIPADVKAHIARVTADGGTVPEQAKMVSMVKKLIAANLWDSCVYFGLPLGGVKKDGNQYVSKVYDLKANADMLQGTGTAQGKYENGNIVCDGGDYYISGALPVANPIRNISNKQTVIIWALLNTTSATEESIIGRWSIGSTPGSCLWVLTKLNTKKISMAFCNGGTFPKLFEFNDTITSGWHQYAFTFDGSLLDGGVNGVIKMYLDGVYVSNITKKTNQSYDQHRVIDRQVQISGVNNSATLPLLNGSKFALAQIYNSVLSDSQMLWNFNNIRPEGV